MVRRVYVVRDDDEPERPPRQLPQGPTRPDPDLSGLPALPAALPLLSGDERVGVNAQTLAARFVLGYSPNTARAYAGQLRAYFVDCARQGIDPLDVDAAFVEEYAAALQGELIPSAVSQRLSVIRSFYRYAAEERVLPASPAEVTATRAHVSVLAPITVDSQAVDAHQAAAGFLLGYSGNSQRAYEAALRSFFTWCFRMRVNPLAVTRPHVEAWRLHLEEEKGLAAATTNQQLTVIRSFFRYCVEEELLDRSPAASVRNRKTSSGSPNAVPRTSGLTRHELTDFLEEARAYNPLYHAVISLLALNGLRATEPGTADLDRMTSTRGHRVVYVSRKGYADQWPVPIAPYTQGAIDAYLRVRAAHIPRDHPEWNEETGPLFISERGLRPSRVMVYDWVKRISLRALPGRRYPVHPHELRHTFITLALDAGVPLRDVQDAAGHSNPNTTRRYDRGRHSMDRHATYTLATYLATGTSRIPRAYDEAPREGAGDDEPQRPTQASDGSEAPS